MHRMLLRCVPPSTAHRAARALCSPAVASTSEAPPKSSSRLKKINQAMQVYVERSRKQKAFMDQERAEFDSGKRHLANMMGLDADTMTQTDIDEAIAYLFPSGLYEREARPVMKSPELLHPEQQINQFDEAGRPYHHLFYTTKPIYYTLMKEIATKVDKCLTYEGTADSAVVPEKVNLGGTRWMSASEFHSKMKERVSDAQYANFLLAIEHLAHHSYGLVFSDFIMDYRVSLLKGNTKNVSMVDTEHEHTTEMMTCESTGRAFVRAVGQRKATFVTVEVYAQGTGKFEIDGKQLYAMHCHLNREQCISPFILLDRLTHYDVVVRRDRGDGEAALAGAVRLGVARALLPMLNERQAQVLRLAGYLTRDFRRRERMKINQRGARAKWIWKRR